MCLFLFNWSVMMKVLSFCEKHWRLVFGQTEFKQLNNLFKKKPTYWMLGKAENHCEAQKIHKGQRGTIGVT